MSRLCAVAILATAVPIAAAEPLRSPVQPAAVDAVGPADAPSFRNEVVPILTRQGCNQGACHGKGAGQNGFRLSLRGYAPEWDHDWMTKEVSGRRINIAFPEQSLLVQKLRPNPPCGVQMPIGGSLLPEDIAQIEKWIEMGAMP